MSAPSGDWQARGREALDLVDEILAHKPEKQGHRLTDATQRLCAYREGLIARAKDGGQDARRDLEHVNAVLSVIAAVHFPLGPTPWDELQAARGWLADLVERAGQGAPAG